MRTEKLIFTFLLIACTIAATAQRVKLKDGFVGALKNDTVFNFEFAYDDMRVGRFDKESEYVSRKTAAMNEKLAGSGDEWAKKWVSARAADYEPKFIELFSTFMGTAANINSKYTIIIHTTFTEPGYDVGGGLLLGSSKEAVIDAEVTIVETAHRTKKIAVLTIDKAEGEPGGTLSGTTKFDGTMRLAAAYGKAGKALAKFIKKQ